MNLFNPIVSRLSRPFACRAEEQADTATEFSLKPGYQLTENADTWQLRVQLPGVAKDGLELTVEDGLITLRGRRVWQKPEGWTAVYRESVDATYALTLQYDNTVDAEKIRAELKDGVLQVSLPKAEAAKPRKIDVN